MSTAATDLSAVHSHTAELSEEAALQNGAALPVPAHEPLAGAIAFMMATMGSVATVFALCFAIVSIGRGGSLTLWSSAVSVLGLVWLVTTLTALWASETRGEWG